MFGEGVEFWMIPETTWDQNSGFPKGISYMVPMTSWLIL